MTKKQSQATARGARADAVYARIRELAITAPNLVTAVRTVAEEQGMSVGALRRKCKRMGTEWEAARTLLALASATQQRAAVPKPKGKPAVVAPYGTWSRSDWAVDRKTAMHCAPARAAASAWTTSSWMLPVATIA